jgi:hypothetical protein
MDEQINKIKELLKDELLQAETFEIGYFLIPKSWTENRAEYLHLCANNAPKLIAENERLQAHDKKAVELLKRIVTAYQGEGDATDELVAVAFLSDETNAVDDAIGFLADGGD